MTMLKQRSFVAAVRRVLFAMLAVMVGVDSWGQSPCDPSSPTPLVAGEFGSDVIAVGGNAEIGRILVAAASTLRILDSETLQTVRSIVLGGNVVGRPAFVQTNDGDWSVFVSTANGVIQRIRAKTGAIVWARNLQRGSCPADSLGAASVQLRRESSAAFRSTYMTDILYVPTRYAVCSGYKTDNRVYALSADDGSTMGTFNSGGTHDVDVIAGAPVVDLSLDRIYVASERTNSAGQHSLWAIDALSGTLVWSWNAGRLRSGAQAGGDRLYVVDLAGTVQAFDPFGEALWSLRLQFPAGDREMLVVDGPEGRLLLLAGLDGQVRVVRDEGTSGQLAWTISLPDGRKAQTSASGDPLLPFAYVGADDGAVYQIDLLSGTVDAARVIDPASTGSSAVTRPYLFWQDTDGDRRGDSVRVVSGTHTGRLAMYCAPWSAVQHKGCSVGR